VLRDLGPSRNRFGIAFGAHERDRKTALQVDAIWLLSRSTLEIGHRLIGVRGAQHHVVEIGFVHDIDVLQGAINIVFGGFPTRGQRNHTCHAQGHKEGVAHVCVLLLPRPRYGIFRIRYSLLPRRTTL
jgi:hypothetical protein